MDNPASNNHKKSARQIVTIIYRLVLVGLASIAGLIVLYGLTLCACDVHRSHTNPIFESIHMGDSKETVIAKMGKPSHIENSSAVYRSGFYKKCEGECAERLWWEYPICLDEAWIVEFNKDQKVIDTGSIFSP